MLKQNIIRKKIVRLFPTLESRQQISGLRSRESMSKRTEAANRIATEQRGASESQASNPYLESQDRPCLALNQRAQPVSEGKIRWLQTASFFQPCCAMQRHR